VVLRSGTAPNSSEVKTLLSAALLFSAQFTWLVYIGFDWENNEK